VEPPELAYCIRSKRCWQNRRWRRAFSRTFHQRRPEIYAAITKAHRPWEAYPTARLESPDVTQVGLSADQATAASEKKKHPVRLVVLTFDDAVKSHLTKVAPLRVVVQARHQHNTPSTFSKEPRVLSLGD